MERARDLLQEKVKLSDEHYAAAFLCPNVRSLSTLPEEEVERAHNAVRRLSEMLPGKFEKIQPDISVVYNLNYLKSILTNYLIALKICLNRQKQQRDLHLPLVTIYWDIALAWISTQI